MSPRVRPMERSDVPAVLDAWEDLMATGRRADPRFGPSARARDLFRGHLRDRVFGMAHPFPPAWVAADGPIVGWLQGFALPLPPLVDQPPTARVADLWVHPDHRRRGLGAALVRAFTHRARAAGYPWIEVGTLARDPRAVAFWRSQGFGDWKVVLLQDGGLEGPPIAADPGGYSATQGASPSTSIRQGSSSTMLSEKK